ncbi:MAG: ATP-binding cassette domain-containing protein, partial [Candidatus Limnocylindrus sp.]
MSSAIDPRSAAAPHDVHPAEKPGVLVKSGSEPVLRATRIAKWFGDNHVLRGASITVWPGETVCILGRSGSGKSTFLRSLNFLEEPTDGRVEIDGVVVEADPFHNAGVARQAQIREARLRAGMVFQEFNLFPHLSVIGNCVEAPVHVKGMARKEAEAIAEKYLEKVGLLDKRDE